MIVSELIRLISVNSNFSSSIAFAGKLTADDREEVDIVSLRNPSSEGASRYIYAGHLKLFFELMCFSEEPRSWFLGKKTCSNGNLYMTNPFDPLFWGLYYIRLNCTDRCVPIDQAIVDEEFKNTHIMLDVLTTDQLSMVKTQLQSHYVDSNSPLIHSRLLIKKVTQVSRPSNTTNKRR